MRVTRAHMYEREIVDKSVCSQTEPAGQNAAKQKIF